MDIEELVVLYSARRGDWRFQSIGSTCDGTPDDEKRWTKQEILGWLSDEGFKFLGNYKYGKIYIRPKG